MASRGRLLMRLVVVGLCGVAGVAGKPVRAEVPSNRESIRQVREYI